MPADVTFAPPHGIAGPGLPVQLSYSGTPPSGAAQWQIQFFAPGNSSLAFYVETYSGFQNRTVVPFTNTATLATYQTSEAPTTDDQVAYQVNVLNSSFATLESISGRVQWDAQTGIGNQNRLQASGTSGFTATDRANVQQAATQTNQLLGLDSTYQGDTVATVQLVLGSVLDGITATLGAGANAIQTTIGNIFSGHPMTDLTEGDLGSACFPEVLTSTLPIGGSAYGLQIQATVTPDYLAFTGPGDVYSQQVIYEVILERSGNIILREGVHELTKLIYPLPGVPSFPLGLELPLDPGNYTLTVRPQPNVCVAAQLLGFP